MPLSETMDEYLSTILPDVNYDALQMLGSGEPAGLTYASTFELARSRSATGFSFAADGMCLRVQLAELQLLSDSAIVETILARHRRQLSSLADATSERALDAAIAEMAEGRE